MKVRVTNIPLDAFAEGIVDVPDGTTDGEMQEAVGKAMIEQGYQPIGQQPSSYELNEGLVRGGWEFSLEKIG